MSTYQVEETAVINAPATHVYNIIADYHEGHPSILPKEFTELKVLEGGIGAGTRIYVAMNVMGNKAEFDMIVTEPEPGRVLQETDSNTGTETTFTVEPISETQSKATIATKGKTSGGIKGWFEKLMVPPMTRRIFKDELAILNEVAQKTLT